MELDLYTLDDLPGPDQTGTVLVRVDINAPLDDDGRPVGTARFRAHLATLADLEDRAVVLLAHQGRPGRPDCVTLAPHAEVLTDLLGRPVRHVPDLFGAPAQAAVEEAGPGDVVLLENTRMFPEEKADPAPDHPFAEALAPLADAYVLDAFAAAHRADASLVALPRAMWACAGRLVEAEVRALARAIQEPDRPAVLVLGGAKPDDSIAVAERMLGEGRADALLPGGAVANLLLQASGTSVGPPNWGFVQHQVDDAEALFKRAEALLEAHGDKVHLPVDVALDREGDRVEVPVSDLPASDPIHDLGSATVDAYRDVLADAGTVVVNGPLGVYEHPGFGQATREVLAAVAASPAFTVAGGGHTAEALERFGIEGFDHVSTGGGALLAYLAGTPMPALTALVEARLRAGASG